MKIVQEGSTESRKPEVGTLQPGDTVINGEGNLCMVARSGSGEERIGKTRLVNLQCGGVYYVNNTCRHERVDAVVTWKYR